MVESGENRGVQLQVLVGTSPSSYFSLPTLAHHYCYIYAHPVPLPWYVRRHHLWSSGGAGTGRASGSPRSARSPRPGPARSGWDPRFGRDPRSAGTTRTAWSGRVRRGRRRQWNQGNAIGESWTAGVRSCLRVSSVAELTMSPSIISSHSYFLRVYCQCCKINTKEVVISSNRE